MNNFSDWLLEEMNKRDWSQADLARASGLNRQSVSDYINQRRTNPEPNALVAIAKGLNLSPITVFRKAGLLPNEGPDKKINMNDWENLLSDLSDEDREEIKQLAILKLKRRKKERETKISKNN